MNRFCTNEFEENNTALRESHRYFKSSDCPICPICEQEPKPMSGVSFLITTQQEGHLKQWHYNRGTTFQTY